MFMTTMPYHQSKSSYAPDYHPLPLCHKGKNQKLIIHYRHIKTTVLVYHQNSHSNTYLFSCHICWDSTYQHHNTYPRERKQHCQDDSQSKIDICINILRIYRICLSMVLYTARHLTLKRKKNKHKLLYFINAVRLPGRLRCTVGQL